MGADGYVKQLLLWMIAPVVLVVIIVIGALAYILCIRRTRLTMLNLLKYAAPSVLRVAFLLYPIVTNIAFEAFSCFEFEDGRSWLVADVSIECGTDAHAQVTSLAGIAGGASKPPRPSSRAAGSASGGAPMPKGSSSPMIRVCLVLRTQRRVTKSRQAIEGV